MKKSKLLLALAVSAMLINSAYASEMRNDQKVNEIEAEDPITNPKVAEYKVKKIYEEGVDIVDVNNEADVYNVPKSYFKGMDLKEGKIFTLYTNREILESDPAKFGKVYKVIEGKESHVTSDIYVIKTINEEGVDLYLKSNPDDLYNVPKKEFKDIELKEGKEVEIVADDVLYASYPAKFTKIHKISEVKPKEEKVVRDFVVKEINEEGVTLYEVGNESNLYNVPKSEFKDMKVEKGKVFTITSDNISLKSYPAQFGKIFSIVEKKMPAKTMVKSYVVEKVADDMVTVHEKDNKDSKYNIAKKDFGKAMPKVGETYKIETSEEILTSDPAQFAKVIKAELEKEAPKKAEKPADKKKTPEKSKEKPAKEEKAKEKTLSDIFVVEKIDQDGVTVYRKSNKEDKYLVPKKDFGKLTIKEGKEYKIFTNDVVLTSYPAQFGKIIKIEEVMAGKNKQSAKNPKTGLVGTSLALVTLIGAGIGYKKIK
ncbi:hypothetical protein K8P03_07315 [Anaerococcus murdochii]|uniref:LPXTG-motif cell wall anchor domain protein n=1 Tax=Anaerococcus murdochii TaxID=411577 RepID=A0ABS7T000_9FIRM|nr:hypothetical protein [Anaerococcus murdochii]MBZ2387088.1 hypothetical protein [Anaerococcus murdochii]